MLGFFPHWVFPALDFSMTSGFAFLSQNRSHCKYIFEMRISISLSYRFQIFFYSMTWTFIQKKSNIELLNVQYRTSKIRDRSFWKRCERLNPVKDLPWMTVMEDIRSVKKWNVQCLQPTEPRGHLRLGRS